MAPKSESAADARDLSADEAACVLALRELILAGESYRLAAATYLGVSITDSQAISYVLARGPMGQQDLAEVLGMTTGSITALVDRLCERGYFQRAAHPTDRRRSIVQLTTTGTRRLAKIRLWLLAAFADVPASDLAGTAATLRSVADGLRVQSDSVPTRPRGQPAPPRRRR